MFKILTAAFLFLFIEILPLNAKLVISEVMPANDLTAEDANDHSSDWLELYNSGNQPENLANYAISNGSNFSKAFLLPDTIIQPGEYILLWASDKMDYPFDINRIAASADVFGRWTYEDKGFLNYLEVTGDCEATVRVNSMFNCGEKGDFGLCFRDNLGSNSRYIGIVANEHYNTQIHIEPSENPDVEQQWFILLDYALDCNLPNEFLRIKKIGDTVFLSASIDGYYWHRIFSLTFHFPEHYYVCLFFAPNTKNVATATFSELKANGVYYPDGFPNSLDYKTYTPSVLTKSKEIHLPFKLNSEKESLYLWSKQGLALDSIAWSNAEGDVSYGRFDNETRRFIKATPGGANSKTRIGRAPMPVLNRPSGYCGHFEAELIGNYENQTIRYALNGEEPTDSSDIFPDALPVDSSMIIRLKSFPLDTNYLPSRIATYTYLFDEEGDLPTIIITAPYAYLWSDTSGVLYEGYEGDSINPPKESNLWKGLESPANITYLKGNTVEFNNDIGFSIHGVGCRVPSQKAYDINYRYRYGENSLNYQLYSEKSIFEFSKFTLRNSSQDWGDSFLRDPLASLLAVGLNIERQAFKPVRVYINNYYWGLFFLQEKSNEHFIEMNYKIDNNEVDIFNILGEPTNGSSKDYVEAWNAIAQSDLTNDSTFLCLTKDFDLGSFIDYFILEMYAENQDWLRNNVKIWRDGKKKTKWRFIGCDFDNSLSLSTDTSVNMFACMTYPVQTLWFNDTTYTLLFRKMISNEQYRNRFLNRFADLMNTSLGKKRALFLLDSLVSLINNEVPRQRERWGNFQDWDSCLNKIRFFINVKDSTRFRDAVDVYKLEGTYKLKLISSIGEGFEINTLPYQQSGFCGRYFKDIPVRIRAKSKIGWRFVGWSLPELGSADEILLTTHEDSLELTAYFVEDGNVWKHHIVINEIMYKCAENRDTKDWIGIFNNSEQRCNLSGWQLKDDNDLHVFHFPENTYIEPFGFLVICEDTVEFKKYHNISGIFLGNIPFGFGRPDWVRLYDENGVLIDSVAYDIVQPWPTEADGKGPSLELISPFLDNTLPTSWKASFIDGGTPCAQNSVFNTVEEILFNDGAFNLMPNPSSEFINIDILQDDIQILTVEICNYMGDFIVLSGSYVITTGNRIIINSKSLSDGIYYVVVTYKKGFETHKKLLPAIVMH
jgi:hypothetical protein